VYGGFPATSGPAILGTSIPPSVRQSSLRWLLIDSLSNDYTFMSAYKSSYQILEKVLIIFNSNHRHCILWLVP
jgi:hypothetical protein